MKKYDIVKPLEVFYRECWDCLAITRIASHGILPGPSVCTASSRAIALWQEAGEYMEKALELAGAPSPVSDEGSAALDEAIGRFAAKYRAKKTSDAFIWQEEQALDPKTRELTDVAQKALFDAKTDAYAHLMLAATAWVDYGFRTEANLGIIESDGKLSAKGYVPKNSNITPLLVSTRECLIGALEQEGWSKKQMEDAIGTNYPELQKTFEAIKENERESGGCYVATAVYGSYNCPEVWTLRRYRDYSLAATRRGRLFVQCYYAISPTLVRWFGKTGWFKKACRTMLDPLVATLRRTGYESTPYVDHTW